MTADIASCLGPPVLSNAARIEQHTRGGLWGQMSLPAMFDRHVARHASRLALIDPPDRPSRGGGPARRLSYDEADTAIRRLAARFIDLGLRPGDIVALQLPQQVEAPIAMLACLGLGFIVCPLPLTWRRLELEAALRILGARAVITSSAPDGRERMEAACSAAFRVGSIRFVFGFGRDLADGVTPLDGAFDGSMAPPMSGGAFPLTLDANAIGLVVWDESGDGAPRALARSHNEWAAAGTGVTMAARLEEGCTILNPFALTAMPGLAGAFVPWLLTGGTLVQHLPFDLGAWRQQMAAHRPDWALVPSLLASVLARPMGSGRQALPRCLGLVGTDAARPAGRSRGAASRIRLVDLSSLALYAQPDTADPATVPLGAVRGDGAESPILFETRSNWKMDADGEEQTTLAIRGACAPSAIMEFDGAGAGFLPPGDDGFISGRLPISLGSSGTAILHADAADERIGGQSIDLSELDRLYGAPEEISDAVAVPIPDAVMGRRLVAAVVPAPGHAPTLDHISRHLDATGAALHKYPDRLFFVDTIPRNDMGGVDRRRLIEAA